MQVHTIDGWDKHLIRSKSPLESIARKSVRDALARGEYLHRVFARLNIIESRDMEISIREAFSAETPALSHFQEWMLYLIQAKE